MITFVTFSRGGFVIRVLSKAWEMWTVAKLIAMFDHGIWWIERTLATRWPYIFCSDHETHACHLLKMLVWHGFIETWFYIEKQGLFWHESFSDSNSIAQLQFILSFPRNAQIKYLILVHWNGNELLGNYVYLENG